MRTQLSLVPYFAEAPEEHSDDLIDSEEVLDDVLNDPMLAELITHMIRDRLDRDSVTVHPVDLDAVIEKAIKAAIQYQHDNRGNKR